MARLIIFTIQFYFMQTILVPTDFSDTAINAARYAAGIAKQLNVKRIILYNAFQTSVSTDANMGVVELVDLSELSKISEDSLELAKRQLAEACDVDIEISTLSECTLLTAGVDDVCRKNNIDLIVMGITGGGKVVETLIGSYAVHVARHAKVPVIIVPPDARYTSIERVMFACDLKQVVETTPVDPLKKILDTTKAKLFVLNVDHNNKNYSADTPFESAMLDALLQGYNPEYSFVDDVHFTEAINKVAKDKQVQLIITIPKKHGWFDTLFKGSHTKALAFHSHVPLMVMRE